VTQADVAVLGCGHWGRNIVRVLRQLGALRGVCDPSPSGRAAARETAPSTTLYASPEELFADDGVRGVMIATPPSSHHALAAAAIEAGIDVFVEKPLTVELDQARDLLKRAGDTGRILMVGHLLEYHPAFVKLHELLHSGALGKIRYLISNRLNLGRIRTEENALWSFAPHDVAVILRLVGSMPFQVVATGGAYVQPNIADATVTQLLFDNGVRAHVFVSWLHPFKEQKLVVIGSEKMASYDDIRRELVLYDQRVDLKEGEPVPVRGEGVSVAFSDTEPLLRECQHFLNCIEKRERPLTDGVSGLRVLQVLSAAQRSMAMNGSGVSFPLQSPGMPASNAGAIQRGESPPRAGGRWNDWV
jgi:predicted dehydrogenase